MPNENIKYVDNIRVIRLYDGKWYCLFTDYRTYKTAILACYSINSFNEWCEKNNLLPLI